jgi:hypothetical protein
MSDELAVSPEFWPGIRNSSLSLLVSRSVFWLVLFAICLGLGYPTLNRYDARKTGHVDSAQYYRIVEHSPAEARGHWRYRVLVPYLAKPVFHAAKGRVGSWDPVFLGLLVVNAAFVASTVVLLSLVCGSLVTDASVAIMAGCLYLLNFAVPNEQLAGMVDSAEAFFLMAVAWALLRNRWYLLPMLAVGGALGKETFVPLAMCFAGVWWVVSPSRGKTRIDRMLWIAAMAVCGLGTATAVYSSVEGSIVWPWSIAASVAANVGCLRGLAGCLRARTFWYPFLWQVPLGIWQLKNLPRPWVLGSIGSAAAALLLGAYANAEGNVSRAMFDCVGPVLSLSSAMTLAQLGRTMGQKPEDVPATERRNVTA